MKTSIFAGVATCLLLAGSALAADMTAPSLSFPHDGDKATRMAKACEVFKLRAATMLGRIEAGLQLAKQQTPLYEQWREAVLSSIASSEPACSDPGILEAGLVEHMERQQRIYEKRAAALKAELPPLTALRTSLNEKQRSFLDQAVFQSRFKVVRTASGATAWETAAN